MTTTVHVQTGDHRAEIDIADGDHGRTETVAPNSAGTFHVHDGVSITGIREVADKADAEG